MTRTEQKSKPSSQPSKTPRHGTSPILDEQAIYATLQVPAALETLEYTRFAAANSVAACFDRKVDRDFFIDVLNLAFNINEHARRFQFAAMVVEGLQATPPLPIEKIVASRDLLGAELEEGRKKLMAKMAVVVQMPDETDPIH